MIEKSNTNGRSGLKKYNQKDTPRYYPYGTLENAGQAHIRLHEATRNQGIKLKYGNPGMNDTQLLENYRKAYGNDNLSGIRGDLRTPNGKTFGSNITPSEAFDLLLKWGETN